MRSMMIESINDDAASNISIVNYFDVKEISIVKTPPMAIFSLLIRRPTRLRRRAYARRNIARLEY